MSQQAEDSEKEFITKARNFENAKKQFK